MDAPSLPTLWLLSPLYLDVEAYGRLRSELQQTLRERRATLAAVRFVVVDDSAGSDPELARLGSDLTVVTPPFNLGHQRAIVYGLRRLEREIADDDLVVTMDADGEDQPGDLGRLLDALAQHAANRRKLVLARRTTRQVPLAFRVLYFFFTLLFRALTGTVIRTGNFAAFRGWTVRHVIAHPHFDLCYASSLISLNLDASFVPCARGRRYAGRSHMGYLKLVRHGLSMLMPFLDRIAVRASIAAALGLVLGGGLWLALALAARGGWAVPGWAGGAALALALASFLALGNLLVLFAAYSQSQSAALSRLERGPEPATRSST